MLQSEWYNDSEESSLKMIIVQFSYIFPFQLFAFAPVCTILVYTPSLLPSLCRVHAKMILGASHANTLHGKPIYIPIILVNACMLWRFCLRFICIERLFSQWDDLDSFFVYSLCRLE